MTQMKEGDSKLRHGPAQSRSGHQEGVRQVGFWGPFLTEILRFEAGPGMETGLALMILSQIPLVPGFPFWPVIPGYLLSSGSEAGSQFQVAGLVFSKEP